MANIRTAFNNIERKNKVLLTTEKDVVRLIPHKKWVAENKLPIYVLPVEIEFFEKDKALLHRELSSYLEKVFNTNE
jgi:tetraacyldisaccharide-1-P 4'-kinase